MYYVYKHTRLDKNEVFYIGIGTKPTGKVLANLGNTHRALYYRAYEKKKSRNAYWKNIIAKTDYKIEIIFETNNIQLVKQKEIELIALYKNTLCNLTAGGEGIESYKHTQETKEKIRNAGLGRKMPLNSVIKSNKRKYKKIIMYKENFEKLFDSLQEASIYLGNEKYFRNISNCLRGKRPTAYGYKFKYNEDVESQDKELVR